MFQTQKDIEQDAMIRQNAESIRLNAEAIRRQTEALEKIRDHYYPRPSLRKRLLQWFLKAVGAVTIAAGVLETANWYINVRKSEAMAKECAAVGMRLFFREGDAASAVRFLEKAVELDNDTIRYRIELAQVKGFAAIGNLFDLGRPLTPDERKCVDDILADSAYLQEVAPEEAMAHVLAAQAYMLRGETKSALAESDRAVAMEPELCQVHVTACAMHFSSGDIAGARRCLAEAEARDPESPMVMYWKALFALRTDHDAKSSLTLIDRLLAKAPRLALAHLLRGSALMASDPPDLNGAREAFARTLELVPNSTLAMTLMARAHLLQGRPNTARVLLDNAIGADPKDMKSRLARADFFAKTGDWASAEADLDAAIALAPMRADLYRLRANARTALGRPDAAQSDRQTATELER